MMWMQILATVGLIAFLLSDFIYIEEMAGKAYSPTMLRVKRYGLAVLNFCLILFLVWT